MPVYIGSTKLSGGNYLSPLAPSTTTTRVATMSNGGIGATSVTTLSVNPQVGLRIPFKLPETTSRWRISLSLYNINTGASNAVTATGMGIVVGPHSSDGNFTGGTATTVATGDYSIPSSSSTDRYYSPWMTTTLTGGTEYILGTGYRLTGTYAVKTSLGKYWRWTGSTVASNGYTPSVTGGSINTAAALPIGIPLDFVIEYEVDKSSHSSAWLWFGDSITEGVTGPSIGSPSTSSPSTPQETYLNPGHKWGADNNVIVQNYALAGFAARNIVDPVFGPPMLSRQPVAQFEPDGAIIAFGANDLWSGGQDAALRANVETLINTLRAESGNPALRIYLCTVMPRGNFNAADNTQKLSYNAWVRTMPLGIEGYIDFHTAIAGSTTATTIPTSLTIDTVHPTYTGQDALVGATTSTVNTSYIPRPIISVKHKIYLGDTLISPISGPVPEVGRGGNPPRTAYSAGVVSSAVVNNHWDQVAGDICVLAVVTTTAAANVNTPTGMTAIVDNMSFGTNRVLSVFIQKATGSAGTRSLSFAGGTTAYLAGTTFIKGDTVDPTNAIGPTSTRTITTAGTPITTGDLTTASDNNLIFHIAAFANSGTLGRTVTWSSGATEILDYEADIASTNITLSMAISTQATAGLVPTYTATASGSVPFRGIVSIAYQPVNE